MWMTVADNTALSCTTSPSSDRGCCQSLWGAKGLVRSSSGADSSWDALLKHCLEFQKSMAFPISSLAIKLNSWFNVVDVWLTEECRPLLFRCVFKYLWRIPELHCRIYFAWLSCITCPQSAQKYRRLSYYLKKDHFYLLFTDTHRDSSGQITVKNIVLVLNVILRLKILLLQSVQDLGRQINCIDSFQQVGEHPRKIVNLLPSPFYQALWFSGPLSTPCRMKR